MPLVRDGRPLKRWRYVGVYTAELMLCVGEAHVGGLPQRWWAVALPDGTLVERTTLSRGGVEIGPRRVRVEAAHRSLAWPRATAPTQVSIELELGEAPPVEVVSPHGRSYIWTAKRAPVHVRGQVRLAARAATASYSVLPASTGSSTTPPATTRTSPPGAGRPGSGAPRTTRVVAWNLVDGVHDGSEASERTVWIDGRPREVEPQLFAADLSRVGDLAFSRWSAREHAMSLGVVRTRYLQPFGTFSGALPGGLILAEGYGVMEDHDVRW